jgi:co-chaperonin GroES (HSP10)
MYTHAKVVAIGPGNVSAAGARSETFDLRVGQTVLVKHKEGRPVGGGRFAVSDLGVEYREDFARYKIFEQTSILGIIV